MPNGTIETNATLAIPNQQIQAPIGTLTLRNNGQNKIEVILRLNGAEPLREFIQAGEYINKGVHDNSSVKNLGLGLIDWEFH
jgi:hypothetical protein